ncbi:methylglyoxal synthase [Algoriphagus sediminis]|uniref:Methylglyoxal synthase n=1 Tax=Algoriphagus sediminis TaxID=3057113 RepID=A0ABT7YA26_9BACT|nr:methylglyoxal synthase [Algoriphagus sediminis]MDN3203372.1 methylglyoxal synthase [Algoriphagus sediminis]
MKIALIAHDGKKADMVHFLSGFKDELGRRDIELVATGTTGSHIEKSGFRVNKMLSGPLGGDAQIAAMAAQKELGMVIFFRDPLDKHPHEPDVQMLMRICDVHNIPLATNPASADLMFKALTHTFDGIEDD